MTTRVAFYFPDPVPDHASLYDRDSELADVLESLKHRTTIVLGGRLIGKTSLLNVVALAGEEQGDLAVIRLAPADSREDFMAEILDGIRQWVDEHGLASSRVPGPGQHDRTVVQFRRRIAALADCVTGVVFLLCIDEFDSLVENLDRREARLVLELIAYLDAIPNLPIRFLLTMSAIPELVRTSYSSTFVSKSTIVPLGPWDTAEAASFVEWLVDDRVIFDEDALAILYAAAGGHPYFTKAVLRVLLAQAHRPGSRYVSAVRATAAVQQVARSPEVDLALTNLVSAHLSANAAAILDRAANSPAGVPGRSLSDIPLADQILASLQADGILRREGDRYLLRLGLWREWRATRGVSTEPPIRRSSIGRAVRRIRLRRPKSYILFSAIAGPLLIVLIATALLTPTRTISVRPCDASKLEVHATYPEFASVGDQQQIHVTVLNNGQVGIGGSAILSFPPGQARMDSSNGIPFNVLPGEETTLDADFTTIAEPGSHVSAKLAVSAGGAICQARRWSISVAPIPRLQAIQKVAGGLLVLFLIPLVVELVARRFEHEEHGSRANVSAAKDA